MIFAIADHIKQIIEGSKTQTRRSSDRYKVGHSYAIQPGRGKRGIPEGRILITEKRREIWPRDLINKDDAFAEGEYTPEMFEKLYEKIHSDWRIRWAYTFRFIPSDKKVKKE